MDAPSDPGFPALPPTQHELPYDDGEPMESDRHFEQMHLLVNSLRPWLGDRRDVYIAGNRAVYFSLTQARNQDFRAPDFIAVLGIENGREERLSWVAWEENGRLPNVVVEIVSPSTEREDRVRKKQIYAKVWRLPEYFIYDPFTHRLDGWDLDVATLEYHPKTPNARGDLPARQLGLSLGLRELPVDLACPPPSLRWIDEDGIALPTPSEIGQKLVLEVETRRRELENERERAEQEKQRAEQEKHRAEQEKHRADEAEARALEMEQRMRELEDELQRLRTR